MSFDSTGRRRTAFLRDSPTPGPLLPGWPRCGPQHGYTSGQDCLLLRAAYTQNGKSRYCDSLPNCGAARIGRNETVHARSVVPCSLLAQILVSQRLSQSTSHDSQTNGSLQGQNESARRGCTFYRFANIHTKSLHEQNSRGLPTTLLGVRRIPIYRPRQWGNHPCSRGRRAINPARGGCVTANPRH